MSGVTHHNPTLHVITLVLQVQNPAWCWRESELSVEVEVAGSTADTFLQSGTANFTFWGTIGDLLVALFNLEQISLSQFSDPQAIF